MPNEQDYGRSDNDDGAHDKDEAVKRSNEVREGLHLRPNVGVDRHAPAARREAYAHQHASRRAAGAWELAPV
jgi:hypothetical protein